MNPYEPLPDWRLPAGVSRTMWEYAGSSRIAEDYEKSIRNSPVAAADRAFLLEVLVPPGRVLDLGCGTGRHLELLARRGFSVVGVDLSREMLRRAAQKGSAVRLVRANLADLDCLRDASFDACLCMFGTLGMVQGKAIRDRVLRHAARLLVPGGRLLLHVHNRWAGWRQPQERWRLLADLLPSFLRGRAAGDRNLPPHQGLAGLTMHLFSKGEICGALARSQFQLEQLRPIGYRPDGGLSQPRLFPSLRAQGFLLAARRLP